MSENNDSLLAIHIRQEVCEDPDLTTGAKLLFVYLLDLALNPSIHLGRRGQVAISQTKLCERLSFGERNLRRYTGELREKRLIWTNNLLRPNHWPVITYHISAFQAWREQREEMRADGLWGNGKRQLKGNSIVPRGTNGQFSEPTTGQNSPTGGVNAVLDGNPEFAQETSALRSKEPAHHGQSDRPPTDNLTVVTGQSDRPPTDNLTATTGQSDRPPTDSLTVPPRTIQRGLPDKVALLKRVSEGARVSTESKSESDGPGAGTPGLNPSGGSAGVPTDLGYGKRSETQWRADCAALPKEKLLRMLKNCQNSVKNARSERALDYWSSKIDFLARLAGQKKTPLPITQNPEKPMSDVELLESAQYLVSIGKENLLTQAQKRLLI